MAYEIRSAAQVAAQLQKLPRRLQEAVRDAVLLQLSQEPGKISRNRKPLKSPLLGATWELRCGPGNTLRVFYNIGEADSVVYLLAVGVKSRDRLYVGGEEVEK